MVLFKLPNTSKRFMSGRRERPPRYKNRPGDMMGQTYGTDYEGEAEDEMMHNEHRENQRKAIIETIKRNVIPEPEIPEWLQGNTLDNIIFAVENPDEVLDG